MSSATARPRLVRTLTAADAIVGAIAALNAWVVRAHSTPTLADPHQGGGLVDYAAVTLATLFPSSPLAPRLMAWDTAVLMLSVCVLAIVAARASGSRTIGVSVGIAAAFLPVLDPVFGEMRAVDWLGPALIVAGLPSGHRRLVVAGLALGAASWPDRTMVLAVLALLLPSGATETWRPRLTGTAVVGGVGILGVWLLPTLPGEASRSIVQALLPSISAASFGPAAFAASAAGPYLGSLALVGVVTSLRGLQPSAWLWVVLYLAVLSTVDGSRATSASALLVALCLGAAVGLTSLAATAGPARGGRLAALAFSLLLPALLLQSWLDRRLSVAEPAFGHAALTLDGFLSAVGRLAPNGVLVREDALTDVLLRAARAKDRITTTEAALARLETWTGSTNVYAMPRAQRSLASRGFRLQDVSEAPGFARVESAGSCRGLSERWRTFADWSASGLSIAAREVTEFGPATVYAAFDAPPQLQLLDWPIARGRGTYIEIFDLADANQRARLTGERRADRLPEDLLPQALRFVARMELWRPPGAPLRLSLDFGATPTLVVAAMAERAAVKRLDVCPVVRHEVWTFQ